MTTTATNTKAMPAHVIEITDKTYTLTRFPDTDCESRYIVFAEKLGEPNGIDDANGVLEFHVYDAEHDVIRLISGLYACKDATGQVWFKPSRYEDSYLPAIRVNFCGKEFEPGEWFDLCFDIFS